MTTATSKLNKTFDTIATAGIVIVDEMIGCYRNMIIKVGDRHFSIIQEDEKSYGICLCFQERSGRWTLVNKQRMGKSCTVAARFIERYAA